MHSGRVVTDFGDRALGNSVLVVVDMQEFFCRAGSNFALFAEVFDPEGTAGYLERVAQVVIPTIAGLVGDARGAGVPVVFTEFGSHRDDGSDMPGWARRHNEMSVELNGGPCYPPFADPTCRVVVELAPVSADRVVQKVTSGPAVGTDLIEVFGADGIDTVVVTGVVTNVCVAGMARELADADFDVFVVADGCATIGESAHAAALDSLSTSFATVVTSDRIRYGGH